MDKPSLATEPRTIEQAYQAAQNGLLVVLHDPPGLLILHGSDRLDLVHRMSTNDVAALAPGEIRQTVFTDPVGRTIDLVTLLHQDERTLLVGSTGRAQRLHDWLQKHIFFQDQVTLELPDAAWSLWGAYGPRAAELAGMLGASADKSVAEAATSAPTLGTYTQIDTTFIWSTAAPAPGLSVLTANEQVGRRLSKLGGQTVDQQAFEVLRVEAGLPAPGKEMREDSIPLEISLRPAISFSKGCYIGQEIIARMDSRDQLAKQLVRLRFDRQPEEGHTLELGDRIVGTITSVAHSPQRGWIGIGSVRTQAVQEAVLQADGGALTARIVGPVGERDGEPGR